MYIYRNTKQYMNICKCAWPYASRSNYLYYVMKGETKTHGNHKYLRVCEAICAGHDDATAHVSAAHKCVCTRTNPNTATASAAQERTW